MFVFCGFESLQETYLLADRENPLDRFMGFEKRAISGVRWEASEHATLETTAGYAFDGYYGVGQNQIKDLHDQLSIDSGAVVATSFRVRY